MLPGRNNLFGVIIYLLDAPTACGYKKKANQTMTCLQFYTFSTEAECGQTLFGHDKLITRKPPGKENHQEKKLQKVGNELIILRNPSEN